MEKGLNASLSCEPVLVFVFMHMNWNCLTGESNSWGFLAEMNASFQLLCLFIN